MIQEGFDRGYQVGALFSVMKIIEAAFLTSENHSEKDEPEEAGILKEIEEIKIALQERIPEIKIATNLFK